jgi:stress response protein YsnF
MRDRSGAVRLALLVESESGEVTMTMQTEQLIGARVTDGDGKVVGTVQRVFNDDADGRPVWAEVHAGKLDRFVPLGGSQVTGDGLGVPFDAQKIMSGPDIDADRHMSAAQTDVLKRYFGLTVPAQGGQPDVEQRPGETRAGGTRPGETRAGGTQPGETQPGEMQAGEMQAGEMQAGETQAGEMQAGEMQAGETQAGETQAGETQAGETQAGLDWLIRTEERVNVGTEMLESGRARLHKYVDVEPIEQTVHVYREEYEVERVPISPDEQVRGEIAEGEREIILHEQRATVRKETVPVERVRLVVKRVEEDRTLRDEIRKERVEIDPDGVRPAP